jgi:hypothetical protein
MSDKPKYTLNIVRSGFWVRGPNGAHFIPFRELFQLEKVVRDKHVAIGCTLLCGQFREFDLSIVDFADDYHGLEITNGECKNQRVWLRRVYKMINREWSKYIGGDKKVGKGKKAKK